MILNKYIYREILLVFTAVLTILILVYISHRFVRYLAEAAAGTIPVSAILELLSIKLLSKLEIFIPVSFYISVLLGLGRMYKDNEITAMSFAGIGLTTIAGQVFRLSLVFAMLTMFLSLYVSPEIVSIEEEHKEKAREEFDITGIYPGHFREIKGRKHIVYVEDVSPDKRSMQNIFVQSLQAKGMDVLVANSAHQMVDEHKKRFIVLEDGRRYAGKPGDLNFMITRFERHTIHVQGSESRGTRHHGINSLPTSDLLHGRGNPRYAAELQWRLSLPISLVVLSLLAVVLARTSSSGGRYAKLTAAILAYFLYNNLIGIARTLVERGDLNPSIGLLSVHGIVILIVVGILIIDHTNGAWRTMLRSRLGRMRQ
uniref:Lipopolysaccharide export system permease protein LptF n=1 Tax=Candidatus Kentrum sp. TUN TaxID=2126343 RepID=A0A451ALZ3_9GAMM|nr:MAG: lipopolysaccharide export system permease protein [Candidatus Kentron sp. TUN]VFK60869.1 MAG: lipopolysaccharide export system permease protein [Candidatus Kentron sp. TUN]VFK67060.1 MAG: lipopolysaccharide export system permease protein [Candidatus Kentron sp. TUN]